MSTWVKSSRCNGTSDCVEVSWRRSTKCDAGTCVEVNIIGVQDTVLVRSTTAPTNSISFTADEWRAFIAGVKDGEFDL